MYVQWVARSVFDAHVRLAFLPCLQSLRSLNIFRWIDAVLEEGDPAGDYPTKADVVVRLAEKPRIFLRSDLQHELRTGENTIVRPN